MRIVGEPSCHTESAIQISTRKWPFGYLKFLILRRAEYANEDQSIGRYEADWTKMSVPELFSKPTDVSASVTRLGDILHFGQPFKAGVNNYFTRIAHIVRQFL